MKLTRAAHRIIGIMTSGSPDALSPAEPQFYERLCRFGKPLDLTVYVFCPADIDWKSERVNGLTHTLQGWKKLTFPLPDLIYDRCFFKSLQQWREYRETVEKLKQTYRIPFLGRGIPGKWEVYRALRRSPLKRFLPDTAVYRGFPSLMRWLRLYGEAVLKPQSGTHGRGVIHIVSKPGASWEAAGRDRFNRVIRRTFTNLPALQQWVCRFIGGRNYLLQQYQSLYSASGEPFDLRVLMQRGGNGRWTLAGEAVRIGSSGGFTSNLHGGGKALDAPDFLKREYPGRANSILSLVRSLSNRIPTVLEAYFGRLAELGIDFGIDRGGNVWIIEINSKPGRSAFSTIRDKDARQRAVENPLHYARYIMDRQREVNA